jgi:hypothetical protein
VDLTKVKFELVEGLTVALLNLHNGESKAATSNWEFFSSFFSRIEIENFWIKNLGLWS